MRRTGDLNLTLPCSRRAFLGVVPAACFQATNCFAATKNTVPSAVVRYNDPSTEFPVVRLTDPMFTSRMPAHYQHSIARHGNYLLYGSDLGGRMDAYRIDLKTGVSHQLTDHQTIDGEDVDARSLTLTGDERSICYLAGGRLMTMPTSAGHVRQVYRVPEGFEAGSVSVSEDALYAPLVEKNGDKYRLRLIRMADGTATTLAESPEPLSDPIARPRRASVLYRRGNGLWLVNYDAQQNRPLRLAEGEAGPALWSPDGRSVFYLNYPADPHKLHNIRECIPDTNEDRAVANTTQFVGFERNPDASVFTGASGSKASPHVLLLVRTVKRELTLCEHRASDPSMVSPIFAPNSQHVYFSSDQHGKLAIYSVAVEKFVSETDNSQ